jgi:hypothetical protein
MEKPKLDPFSYHEIMDRVYLIGDMVDRYLIYHPVTKLNPELNKKLNEASTALYEAYQMMSQISENVSKES